jgi:two-component system, cell cycle sensor histidine kinase and response regulator CckA
VSDDTAAALVLQRLERTEARLRVLSDVTRSFAEATSDYARLLQSVATSLADVVKDSCVVFLLSPDQASVAPATMHAVSPEVLADMHATFDGRPLLLSEQAALRQVLATGQPLLVPHVKPPEQRSDTTREQIDWQERLGLRSFLVVALRVQGRSIGILSLGRFGGAAVPFNELDVELAQNLADHAALAIENARLLTEAHQARSTAEAAEAGVRRAEHAHRQFFETSPMAIFVVDVESQQIREANAAAYEMYGYSQAEFLKLKLSDLRHPADSTDVQASLRVAGPTRGTAKHQRKDGSVLHVEGGSHLSTFEGKAARFAFVRDDTQRVLAEKRGDSLEEQLRQAQKMEAVGRLAGGIAHDFNNVLSIILGYGEDMLSNLQPDNPLRGDVEEIVRAGSRAAELTKQLLLFSRQQLVESKVLDLNDVVIGMDRMLARGLGEHIELVLTLDRGLGRLRADRGNLEQLLLNLTVNARDAMPSGGRLTIETSNVVLDEGFVSEHLDATPGHYVLLAVTDTGVGMDRDTRARIFDPFFTTKTAGKGTGLGLATVFGIVKQAGGSVWVYSEVGQGTIFKIYFPRVDAEVDARTPSAAPAKLRGTETVLLVEDEAAVRAIAQRILEKNGYRVLVAETVADAVRVCESREAAIDLLLTDVIMPGATGPELAARLLALQPQLRVVYMSGYTDSSALSQGILDGTTNFVQKPFSGDLLARKVRTALDEPAR